MAQVGGHVERKTVTRNPAADSNADGGDLPLLSLRPHPHSGQAFHAYTLDAELSKREDQHFFQIAHVLVHVAPIGFQVEDGIPDELPGAVIRHVSAAACLVNRHALTREFLI